MVDICDILDHMAYGLIIAYIYIAVTLQICDPVALRFCKALPGQCVGSRRLKLRLPRKTTRCHWDATLVVGAHNIGTQL